MTTLSCSSSFGSPNQRAPSLLDVAGLAELLDRLLRQPHLPELVLVIPVVVADVDARDRRADALHHLVDRVHPQLRLGFFLGKLLDPRQVVLRHRRELDDVLAVVSALRRLFAVQPRVHRRAELPRLRVVRVDVVLALDLVAGELEHAADGVPERDAAAVADVQRPGGVHAAELDLQPLATTDVARAVAGRDPGKQSLKPFLAQPEVDIPAGRLCRGGAIGDGDGLGDSLSDLCRRLAQHAGELQAGGACVVTVAGDLRPAKLEVRDVSVDAKTTNRFHKRRLERFEDHQQVGCWLVSVSSACVELPSRV